MSDINNEIFDPVEPMIDTITSTEELQYNTVVINLRTIMKLVLTMLEKDKLTRRIIVDKTTEILDNLTNILVMNCLRRYNHLDINILLYEPMYEKHIDNSRMRDIRTNNNARNMLVTIKDMLPDIKTRIDDNIYLMLEDLSIRHNNMSVYNAPIYHVTDLKKSSLVKGKVLYISNYPVDYIYTKGMKVISTHTGTLWTIDTISSKIFDDELIPFNAVTHAIFGDKYLLRPLVKSSVKEEIIDWLRSRTRLELRPDNIGRYIKKKYPDVHELLTQRLKQFTKI